ncbi:helix-turn-helix transcriptional regulator [Roseibium sp.]|uniref:helix-turn-helix transcriptional regulator n=1 Tax=Roseibium sp. TaxID=1936156 RepID=UPI003298DAB2
MPHEINPPSNTDIRKQIVEDAKELGLLEFDHSSDPARSRRLAEILEQIPYHAIGQIASRLDRELTPGQPSLEWFTAKYSISAAEQKMLAALAAGLTVGQHAQNLNISVNTTRTHMRRLLEKTGSKNQVDLIRKLLRL